MNIADLRKDYKVASLAEKDVAASPFTQFEKWLNEAIAAELPEPNAMTLATVGTAAGGDTRPSTRIVLIKEFDARGPVWFTNYQSRKGREVVQLRREMDRMRDSDGDGKDDVLALLDAGGSRR